MIGQTGQSSASNWLTRGDTGVSGDQADAHNHCRKPV